LLSVEELDECTAGVLAWQMGEDYGCYVGVFDPLVYQADTGVVDCYDCVVALGGYILDEGVGVVV
jgi:hypothetical protein